MYTDYWHLNCKPFESGSDPNFDYPSEAHQGAMLKIRYAMENRRGACLLTGGAGLGKTLLVQSLKRMAPETFTPFVHVVYPKMASHELLAYLACELGGEGDPDRCHGLDRSVRKIEQALRENVHQDRHAIVAIDEAHLLDEVEGLEVVRLLLNFEVDARPGMTLLLVGQPGLLPVLDRLPGLEERLAVKCLLRPLNLEETISYVSHRLTAAGAQRAIFENDALEAVFQLTQGAPRQINRLCDLALLVGYAEQLPSIGVEQLQSISHELVTVSPE